MRMSTWLIVVHVVCVTPAAHGRCICGEETHPTGAETILPKYIRQDETLVQPV